MNKEFDEIKRSKLRKLIIEKKEIDEEETSFNNMVQRKSREIAMKKEAISSQIAAIVKIPDGQNLSYNDLILKIL